MINLKTFPFVANLEQTYLHKLINKMGFQGRQEKKRSILKEKIFESSPKLNLGRVL